MSTKRKQKHYERREQILDDIRKARERRITLEAQAAGLDAQAQEIFKAGNGDLFEDAKYKKSQAKRMRKSASNIEDKRIPKLVQTLSAFDTITLPGVVKDKSVVLQDV